MKNLSRQTWGIAQTKGRDWFVLRYGVLRMGLVMGFLFITPDIVDRITVGKSFVPIPELVVKGLLVALAFGFFWGRWEWNRHLRLYED